VDDRARDRWLQLMSESLAEVTATKPLPDDLQLALTDYLTMAADAMVNTAS
jgi:truncated hemoglobin YjbI